MTCQGDQSFYYEAAPKLLQSRDRQDIAQSDISENESTKDWIYSAGFQSTVQLPTIMLDIVHCMYNYHL